MSDTALAEWLATGAKVELTEDECLARRRSDYSLRFVAAMNPEDDLGPTEEAHQLAVAARVVSVHDELRAFGIEEYDEVWKMLDAPTRRALKAYIAMGSK